MMRAYELLYTLRRAAEDAIVDCDAGLRSHPNDPDLIARRQHHARVAILYHAAIERLERDYDRD